MNILDLIQENSMQENPDSLLSTKFDLVLSKGTEKLLNLTTTPEQKLMLTSGVRLSDKEYHSMYGLTPYIIKLTDGDSSKLFDLNGKLLSPETRHYSAVPNQQLDTGDKPEDITSKTKIEAQMPYYRAVTGKENPTEEDILNVYNWSIIETYKRFTDPNNYMLDPYDASRKYDATAYQTADGSIINIKDTPIRVYGRKLEEGFYGRPLMEYYVEPEPGKGLFSVTDSQSRDPYINAGYKVTSNIDTYTNRAKYVYNTLATREKSADQYNFDWSTFNNVVASISKLWHQWNANYYASKDAFAEQQRDMSYAEIGDNLKNREAAEISRIDALREHDFLSDPEISDAINGVSYRIREAQEAANERQHKYTRMLQQDWAEGNIAKVIKHWAQGALEVRDIWASSFADSAIFTFTPLALSSLIMPVGAATKGAAILKWTTRFCLDTAIMTQMAIQDDIAEFRKNNGYAPSNKKHAEMWINQFIANAPESLGELLLFKFAGGAISKGFRQIKVGIGGALNRSQIDAYARLMRRLGMADKGVNVDPKYIITYNILKGAGIAIGVPALAGMSEGPGQESWQEWYQTFISKYNARNEAKYGHMNQWEFYNAVYGQNNEELWQASTLGGGTGFFMGAALGASGASVRGIKTAKLGGIKGIVSNAKYVKNLFKLDQLSKYKPTPQEQTALDEFDQKTANTTITDQDTYNEASGKVDQLVKHRNDLAGLIPDSNKRKNSVTKIHEAVRAIQHNPNLSDNQKHELIQRFVRTKQTQGTNSSFNNEPTTFFNEEDILQPLDDMFRDKPTDETHVELYNSEENKSKTDAVRALLEATGMTAEQANDAINKRINEAVQVNEEERAQLSEISSNEITPELRTRVRQQVKEELGRNTENHAQVLRDVDEGIEDRNSNKANKATHFFKYMPQTLLNKLGAYVKVLETLTDTSSNHTTRARQAYDRGPKGSNNKGHTLEFTRPIIKANGGNNEAVRTMRNIVDEARKLNELAHTLIDPKTGKTFIDDNEYNQRKEQINQFENQINSNVALITGGKYARKANTNENDIDTQEQDNESKEQTDSDDKRVRQTPQYKGKGKSKGKKRGRKRNKKTVTEDIASQDTQQQQQEETTEQQQEEDKQTVENKEELEKNILEDLQSMDTLLKNSDVSFDNLSYLFNSGIFAENIMSLSYDLSYNIRKYGLDKTKQLIQNSNLPDDVKARILNTTLPLVLLTAKDSPSTVLSNIIRKTYVDPKRQKELDKALKNSRKDLTDIQENILKKAKNKQLIPEGLIDDLEFLYQQIQEIFSSLYYIERLLARNPEIVDTLPTGFKEELKTRMDNFAKLQNETRESLLKAKSYNNTFNERQQQRIDSVDDLSQDLPGSNADNTAENEGSVTTEEATSKDLGIAPSSKGRGDTNSNSVLNQELQKAEENLRKAQQIVASEAALQRTKFYKKILETVHFLKKELIAVKDSVLHNQWATKFNPLRNSDLDNWANDLANSFNQMLQTTFGKENGKNSLEDFAKLLSNNPALVLLFDIIEDPNTKTIQFKFKKIPAVLVACAMIEFVCNPQYNVLFKPNPNNDNEVKAAFGIQSFGRDLSAAELADIAVQQNGGVSLYVVQSKLGALIMAHLGYTIKEDTAEYQYYNKLCTSLGMFATSYLRDNKLPVIGGGTIENPIFVENATQINGKSIRLIKLREEYLEHIFYSFYRKTDVLEREITKAKNHAVNIIFDTETAGTKSSKSNFITSDNQTPIQIHAKKIIKDKNNPNNVSQVEEITIYLQYDQNTYEIAASIAGDRNPMLDIYAAHAKEAKDLNTGLTEFFSWLLANKDAVLIGHNIDQFDVKMLLKVAEKAKVDKKFINKVRALPTVDTLKLSRSTRIGAAEHRQVVIAEEFGFDFGNASAHDATTDVRANEHIFNKFVELNDLGNPVYTESIHYVKSDANILRSMWLNDIKPHAKLSEKYYGFYNNRNKQNYEHNPEHYVRNTGHFIEYTDDMNKALDTLFNEEYYLSDPEIVEFLTEIDPNNPNKAAENIMALKVALGFVDENSEEFKKQTKEVRRSITGTNTSITFEVVGLLKLAQLMQSDKNAALYLSRYFGKNGRVYIDGVEINPQSFKRLQRFLIRSKKNISTYSKKDFDNKKSTTYKQFVFAVAQTFDLTKKMFSSNKGKVTDNAGNVSDNPVLYGIANKLLILTVDQLKELYREALTTKDLTKAQLKHNYFDSNDVDVDNRGQYLALLSFLIRKQESTKDSFSASLPVELDSANSGIAIKFLQLLPSSILETLGPALGFISKNLNKNYENVPTSTHMLRSIKGELIRRRTNKATNSQVQIEKILTDAYSACISDFLNKLTDNGTVVTEKGLDDFISSMLTDNVVTKDRTIRSITENTNLSTSTKLIKLYFAAYGIKAGANIEEVSGALRNLFKIPIMTFMYSAGLNSINKKLGSEIWENFLEEYTEYYYAEDQKAYKDTLNDRQKAVIDFMKLFGKSYFKDSETMYKALMAVTSSELNVNIANKVLDIKIKDMFINYTYVTFSKTMVDLMNNKFKEFKWFNDFMGIVSGYAYRVFERAYKDLVQKLNEDHHGRIPLSALRKGVLKLKDVYPTLAPVIDGYASTLFFANRGFSQDYRKLNDKTPIKNEYYTDDTGNPIVEEGFIEELEWLSPEQAGKVIGIHNIDAFQAMFVQNMMPSITCIFDAFVVDVKKADKVARQYNKGMYLFNMFYNMPLEYFRLFDKSLKLMSEQWYDNEEKEGRPTKRTGNKDVDFKNWLKNQNVLDSFGIIVKKDNVDLKLQDYYTESLKIIRELEAHKRQYFGSFVNGQFIEGSLLRIQNLDGVDNAGYSVTRLKNLLAKHPEITNYAALKEYFTSFVNNNGSKKEFGNDPGFGNSAYVEADETVEIDPNTKLDEDSLEARLRLLERLANEESNPDIDGDYLQEMRELWEASDVLAFLGVDVVTINNGMRNSGRFLPEQRLIKLRRVNAAKYKNRRSYKRQALHRLFQMSLAEIFAHESIHSITIYALQYGPDKLYRQVGFLWETAKAQLKATYGEDNAWRVFLPTNYNTLTDPNQKKVAEKIAQNRYKYVFELNSVANRTEDDIHRLGEFIAYGLSNPALRNIFKNMNFKKVQNLTFFEKLKQAVINLFEVVFKHKSMSEAFRDVQNIINGTRPTFLEYNMYSDLADLVNKLSRYNVNMKQELNLRNPLKVLNMVLGGLFKIPAWMDKVASKLLLSLNELDPEWVKKQLANQTFVLAFRKGQRLRAALSYVKGAGTMLFSSDARAAITEALRTRCNWAQNNFVLTWLREVTEADPATKYIHTFNAARAELEEQAKNIEAIVYKSISDSFRSVLGRDLQLGEQQALYRVVLRGDMQCLLTKYSISDIVKLIADPTAIDTAMVEEKKIWSKNLQGKVYAPIIHFIEVQAQALAKFQEDGSGHLGQMNNALNILTVTRNLGVNTSISYDVEQLNALDRYITLEFLKNRTNVIDRQAILDITKQGTNTKGLQEFLNVHQKYVEDSKSLGSVVTREHIVKGYTHSIFDGSGEVLIASADPITQADLEKKGYVLLYISNTSGENTDKLSNVGVYKAPFPINKKISNSAFTMAGVDSIYLNLDYDSYSDYLSKYANTSITEEEYHKRIRAIQEKRKAAVLKFFDPNFTIKDVEKESGDFLVRPSVDAVSASSFVFTIDEKTALDIGKNINGSRVLANMCGSFVRKSESGAHNQVIVQYLQEYFETYADQDPNNIIYVNGIATYKVRRDNPTYIDPRTGKLKTKYSRSDNMKFVLLTNKKTINGVANPNYDPQIGEMWNKLPISLRDLANRQQIWIRADWVPDLLGVESTSIVEWDKLKNWNQTNQIFGKDVKTAYLVKKSLFLLEQVLKLITHTAKNNIVFRMPRVLLVNVLSNIALSTLTYSNPFKVLKYQFEAFQDLSAYVTAEEEYNVLKYKYDLNGYLTEAEKDKLRRTEATMKRSKLYPLMQANLFGNITRDLESINKDDTMYLQKAITDKIPVGKIPGFVKRLAMEAQMAQGTFMYETMYRLTQYSDFIARAAEFYMATDEQLELRDKNGNKIIRRDQNGKETYEYIKYKEDLIEYLRDKFVNYELPLHKKEQYLNDLGFLMFTKFRKRIQWVLMHGIIEHPITAMWLFALGKYLNYSVTPVHDVFPINTGLQVWHSPITNFENAITLGGFHMLGIHPLSWL